LFTGVIALVHGRAKWVAPYTYRREQQMFGSREEKTASHPGLAGRRRGNASALKVVAYVLLVGECLVILIPSIYGRATPKLFGFPFFYWFQLLWIIVGMVVTGIAYLLIERAEARAVQSAHDGRGGGR
jgi:hypothetical protein